MNTAISIPDPIFETAERLAQTLRISRNELYTRALSAYIRYRNRYPRNRKEFVTTKTLLKAIAPAAMMGLSSPRAAKGMPMIL